MIYKLQRAISSSEKNPPCLAYNEDRTSLFDCHLDPEIFHGEFKIYVEAEVEFVNNCEQLNIKKQVETQDW